MVAQAQVAVRNAGWLIAQRGVHVVSGIVFAVIVPRLMGPTTYGQYALLASLAAWFVLLGTLGFAQIMGRFAPQFVLDSNPASLRKFLGDLLTVRLFSGTTVAVLYLLAMTLWLRESDGVLLVLLASSVLARGITFYFFSIFLGLNQAARWGSEQVLQRWLLLVFLPPGFLLGGLRGACAGLLLADLAMLATGMWWSRSYLTWSGFNVDIRSLVPYLRFGLIFFGTNLLTTAFQRSGEPLVRSVSGDYAQVGYYGAAFSVYLSVAQTVSFFTLAFAPLLTTLRTQGHVNALRAWVERLLKLLATVGVLAGLGAILLSDDLVPLVFGAAYRSMSANLVPLALTLLPLGLGSVAGVIALTHDQPKATLKAATIQLAALWGLGIPLVARHNSLGACVAVLIAASLYAAYLAWRMWNVLQFSIRRWAGAIGLGAILSPLILLKSTSTANVALYIVLAGSYIGALLALRIVTPDEIAAAWRALKTKDRATESAIGE
jgi:O-antigen/teichoic acid export membrane protein